MICRTLPAILGICLFLNVQAYDTSREIINTLSQRPRLSPVSRKSRGIITQRNHQRAAEANTGRYRQRRAAATDLPLFRNLIDDYYTEISIGTPPQSFPVTLDTGSADFWVATSPCDSSLENCGSAPLYDPSKSSTAVNQSTLSGKITIQDFFAGYIFTDTIQVGPSSVSNGAFRSLVAAAGDLADDITSGVMGLAFARVAQTMKTSLWHSIFTSDQDSAPEFSLWLSSDPVRAVDESKPGGVLTLGGTNNSLFSGDIEFLDLTGPQSTWWSLNISDVTVQNKHISTANKLVVFDTTADFIFGPAADVDAIGRAISGSSNKTGDWRFPCNVTVNMTVSFGGRAWPIDINRSPLNFGDTQCLTLIIANATGILATDSAHQGWVFGTPFLVSTIRPVHYFRPYTYSVFRVTPPSIGFAELSTLAGGTGMSAFDIIVSPCLMAC
ncbi:aspartic peptidase domain-containing protein [Mycena capillaripes]|nr:aspartic peptidase domain-containing protein [Mycena capillaripes]